MRDVEVTKMYVRYREGLPDTEMMCYAVLGFQKLGVVIQPFEWVDDVDHREVDASRSPWVTRVMCGTGRPVRSRLNVQNCVRIVR